MLFRKKTTNHTGASKQAEDQSSQEDFKKNNPVAENLRTFYQENKDWLFDYAPFAKVFNPELIERVSLSELNSKLRESSILILSANSVEQNIITRKLYADANKNNAVAERLQEIYIEGEQCIYQFAKIDKIGIVHIHPGSVGSFPRDGSAKAVRNALNRFRPKLVVSLGVAFGIEPREQKMGDVIISSRIIPYDVYNKDTDDIISLRASDVFCSHKAFIAWDVLLRNESFSLDSKNYDRRSIIDREIEFAWQYGAVLSGGSVLSNERKKKALFKAASAFEKENDIIGGEMEGSGVYYECEKPNIPCIVIKGICDWGEEKNSWNAILDEKKAADGDNTEKGNSYSPISNDDIKDCIQAYCAENAYEALFRLLRFDAHFLDGCIPPHPFDWFRSPKTHKKRNKIKENLSYNNIWFQLFFGILFLASCCALIWIYLKPIIIDNKIVLFFSILLVYLPFGLIISHFWIIKKNPLPIIIDNRWVGFEINLVSKLEDLYNDYEQIHLYLNDYRPIFNLTLSYWEAKTKTIIEVLRIGTMAEQSSTTFKIKVIPQRTILQIEYELANGDHYIHLFSLNDQAKAYLSKAKAEPYKERVFLETSKGINMVGKKRGIMNLVQSEHNAVTSSN